MTYTAIQYQNEEGTAVILFNRPEKRNALNEKMMNEIDTALSEAEKDPGISSIY